MVEHTRMTLLLLQFLHCHLHIQCCNAAHFGRNISSLFIKLSELIIEHIQCNQRMNVFLSFLHFCRNNSIVYYSVKIAAVTLLDINTDK